MSGTVAPVTEPAPVTTPAPAADDPFAAAFADLIVEETPAAPEPAPANPEPAPEPTEPAPEPAPEPSPEPSPEPAPQPAPEPPKPAESDADMLARFARLMQAAQGNAPQPPPAPPQAQPEPPPVYTAEEQQLLQTYEKEWPDIAKAEALRRRAEYRDLVGYVFDQFAQQLRPLMATVQTLGERTHLTDLQQTVPDYEDVRDKVIAWVENQPKYLQPAYQHVIAQGTVDEVRDLIDRYRRDAGAAAGSTYTSNPATPVSRKVNPELPAATKQAAASLAPVGSKRSAVAANALDPQDFESAFASFASKL